MFHTIILFFFLLTIKQFDVKTRLSEDGQLPPFFLSSMAAIMQRYLDRSHLLHSLRARPTFHDRSRMKFCQFHYPLWTLLLCEKQGGGIFTCCSDTPALGGHDLWKGSPDSPRCERTRLSRGQLTKTFGTRVVCTFNSTTIQNAIQMAKTQTFAVAFWARRTDA